MTPRYKLRTLLILLAIMPPMLWIGWTKYEAWRAEQERQKALREIQQAQSFYTDYLPAILNAAAQPPPLPPPGTGAQPGR